MPFSIIETSNYDGKPIALFEFSVGTTTWRYCSHEEAVVYAGMTYQSSAISHGEIMQGGDQGSNDLVITLPATEDAATSFVNSTPSVETNVVIRRMHHGDYEAPIIWIGKLASAKQSGLRTMQFTCRSLITSFNRNGLRLSWGRNCPHALYDSQCKVSGLAHGGIVWVDSLNGNTINSSALDPFPEQYFSNGFIEFAVANGSIQRRGIEYMRPGAILLFGTTEGLGPGSLFLIYPGCNRTIDDCVYKFNNLLNFGGFPHLPTKSPFSGDPLF